MCSFCAQICYINFFSAERLVFQNGLHGGRMAKNPTFPESTPKSYPSCKISSDFRFLRSPFVPNFGLLLSPKGLLEFSTLKYDSSMIDYVYGSEPPKIWWCNKWTAPKQFNEKFWILKFEIFKLKYFLRPWANNSNSSDIMLWKVVFKESKLDICMSRLDIRVSIPTMLVLIKLPR